MPYRGKQSTLSSLLNLGYYNQAMQSVKHHSYATQYYIKVIREIQKLPSNPSSKTVESFIGDVCAQLINLQSVYRDEKLTLLSPLLVELINLKLPSTVTLQGSATNRTDQGAVLCLMRTVYNWFKLIRLQEPSDPKLKVYRVEPFETLMFNFEATLRECDTIRDTVDFAEKNSSPGTSVKCYMCLGPHCLYNCCKFLMMRVEKRIESVLKMCLCTNCLKRHDGTYDCSATARCDFCFMTHSTRLHVNVSYLLPIAGPHLRIADEARQLRSKRLLESLQESEQIPWDDAEHDEMFPMEL